MADNIFYLSIMDAFSDCLAIAPFLLVIFYLIEIVEFFYSDKISSFSRFSKNLGPLIGSLLASIPQCGLSVIASTMYCKRLITKGTLIAVYLATSDEAIPVLLAEPKGASALIPLILIKIFIGIAAGYFIDFILPSKLSESKDVVKIEKGCHSHSISRENWHEVLIHPLVHTLSVLFFIFVVTFLINVAVSGVVVDVSRFTVLKNMYLQPVLTAFAGLIPNCAISVGITVLYLKGVITFASCVSGLCASAGLGILILIKNNDKKDTVQIIALLITISILAGFACALLKIL